MYQGMVLAVHPNKDQFSMVSSPTLHYVSVGFWTSAHALGASMEWHFSFPLMKSFNKTEAAIFAMQTMLP